MKRSLLAMLAVLGIAITATAQQGGGGGGGGGQGGGGSQGGGSGGGGGQQLQTQQNTLATLDFSNTNAGLATIGNASVKGGTISTSNAFGPYMANPLYPGRPGSTALDIAKGSGGFGVQSFGTGTSTGNTTGGRGGAATTTTGGRAGGARGGSSTNTFIGSTTEYKGGRLGYGQAPQVAYAAVLKFPPKPVVHADVSADLQGLFSRSSMLSNKSFQAGVDGQTIVLKGKARDLDEKMLVEGMARLTPGVREIRNEIEVP